MEIVKSGDNVSVHYTGKLESGEIFDSSIDREPLSFTAGAGQMIKGFDNAVIGMKVKDKKTITISPKDGYGEIDDSRIVELNKEQFGSEFSMLKKGMHISAGNGISGIVQEVREKTVIVNFNHFLAGKTLIFDIELVSIN